MPRRSTNAATRLIGAGIDLANYGTRETATDLAELRQVCWASSSRIWPASPTARGWR